VLMTSMCTMDRTVCSSRCLDAWLMCFSFHLTAT
jgi:hypothetical protein